MVIIQSLKKELHTEVIKPIINLLHVKESLFRYWKEKYTFPHNLGFAFPGILNATKQPCLQEFPLDFPQSLYHLLTFYLLLFFLSNVVENLFCLKIKKKYLFIFYFSLSPPNNSTLKFLLSLWRLLEHICVSIKLHLKRVVYQI